MTKLGKLLVILIVVVIGAVIVWEIVKADTVQKEVDFSWTATGDDGTVGTAYVYDLRWSTDADSLVNHWVECADIEVPFVPSVSGTPEAFSCTLSFVEGRAYYFAIKVSDEAFNTSGISNLKEVIVTDSTAPAAVADFNVR